jgi:tripartite-type tricarboxylate transporter receptor subunit TctC
MLIKLLLTLFGATTLAQAHAVPAMPHELKGKTITLVVAWNPGGETDAIQRFIVEQARSISGLNIVVQNRGGAAGIIGGRAVAESAADGLTLLGDNNNNFGLNPALQETNHINPDAFVPVAIHGFTPQAFYTGVNSGISSPEELIDAAKNNKKFTVGCNTKHQCLYAKQWFNHFGINPYTVIFRTPTEMGIAAFNNDIQLFGAGITSGAALVAAGKIRPIGVTWNHVLSTYPTAVPLDKWVPGFKANNTQIIMAPVGTPKHIVDYYNTVFRLAAQTPESKKRFNELSIVSADLDIDQVAAAVKQEQKSLADSAKLVDIK